MFPLRRALLVLIVIVVALGLRMRSDNQQPARADDVRLPEAQSQAGDKKDQHDNSPKADDKPDKKDDDAKKSDEKSPTNEKSSDSKSSDDKSKNDKPTDTKASDKDKSASSTFTVKKEPFKVDLSLSGVFESKRTSEVSIHPETWSDWTVKTAVEQGDTVKKGDTLIEFDTTKIDDQISDLQADRKLADLSVDQLSSEIHLLEQSMPLDLRVAERSRRLAADDLNQFVTKDRELIERRANFAVKSYGNSLDYSKEQLKQLEKMYKGEDITKETEEIVLKRTRDQVEEDQFQYEMAKIAQEKLLKIELPRREELLKVNVDRTAMDLQKARTSLPITLDKQRLELEKKKFEREKAADKLAKLQRDRDFMKITAPADGVVYFGACTHGQWTQAAQLINKLRKGGHVSSDEVVMSVVDPETVFVRATLPEKNLSQVKRGLTGSVTPEGYEDEHLPASLDEFSLVPAPEGKYFSTILVDFARIPKDMSVPSPGMNCKVKLTAFSTDSALTLPAKALQTDKQNDEQRYVWLVGSDGKPARRNVTVGHRNDTTVEITEGLAEGDKVLREPPKDEE